MVVVRLVQDLIALLLNPLDSVQNALLIVLLSLRLLTVPLIARLAIPLTLLVIPLGLLLLPLPLLSLLLRLGLLVRPIRGVIRPRAAHHHRQHIQADKGAEDPPTGCLHGCHSAADAN